MIKLFEKFCKVKNDDSNKECFEEFLAKIKNTTVDSNNWKEEFVKYMKCKQKMFNRLKETERKSDQRLQLGIIFCGALIPIVNVILPQGNEYLRIVFTTVLGFWVIIFTGINQIWKYHERSVIFKGVSRALEFEYIKLTKPEATFQGEPERNIYDNMMNILQHEVQEILSVLREKKDDSG
jgi:hypothetical protein